MLVSSKPWPRIKVASLRRTYFEASVAVSDVRLRSAHSKTMAGSTPGIAGAKRKQSTDEEEEEILTVKAVKSGSQRAQASGSTMPEAKSSKPAVAGTLNSFFVNASASRKNGENLNHESPSGKCVVWPERGLGHDQMCHMGIYQDPIAAALAKQDGSKRVQKIAAFDLDGTLIETKSGRAAYNFADEYDFRIWGRTANERKAVADKLKGESEIGSLVVIITSQYGRNGAKLKPWRTRLDHIMRALDVPAIVIVSFAKDAYRKPNAGWMDDLKYLWQSKGGEVPLDIGRSAPSEGAVERSFFVGDAAGRLAAKGRKEDFADTDRKLAENLSWRFVTPEEYFLNESPMKHRMSGYRPMGQVRKDMGKLSEVRARILETASMQKTVVILTGPQASGKSRFASGIEAEGPEMWVRVNQDLLKTRAKCLAVAKEALQQGKSVVVDNTNPTKDVRALWTQLARDQGTQRVVSVHFDLTLDEATHNDHYRSKRWLAKRTNGEDAAAGGPPAPPKLPKSMPAVAFATYYKTLVKPSKENEDLDEVYTVGVEFDGDEDDRNAWMKWYS